MDSITIKSYAKINLSLDVLGLLSNGYHQVEMIMQQVELHDVVHVKWQETEKNKSQIILKSNSLELPLNHQNIAYKAAQLMMEYFKKNGIVEINIEKNIPIAAGLAGGSGNAAAVLHALNSIWNKGLKVKELCDIGIKLGADVPFCIMGQAKGNLNLGEKINEDPLATTCALAEGIGEILTPVDPLECEVLLSKPAIGVSTAEVYKGIDEILGLKIQDKNTKEANLKHNINTKELISGLNTKNYTKVINNMSNMLELFSTKRYPNIMYTKDKIQREGKASKVLMSGSGPTVFGIYLKKAMMDEDYKLLCEINKETYKTKTLI